MADIVLKLLFSGLIAYSPSGAPDLGVLVLNDMNSIHMPHRAFLAVRSGEIQPNSGFDFQEESGSVHRTFIGGGFDLSISPEPTSAFSYKACEELKIRSGSKINQEFCLISASEIWNKGDILDSKWITSGDAAFSKTLALRLILKTGSFKPHQIQGSVRPTGRQMAWVNLANLLRVQYVPEIMEWSSGIISADAITLKFQPFDGGSPREVVIKPDGDKPIEVMISNEPDPLDYCLVKNKATRYSASHLNGLAKLSLEPSVFKVPELWRNEDRDAVDGFCASVGAAGGRQPIICYGVEMRR